MSGVRVRVPCSTSNLGAGFDCVGIAFDRWLEAGVSVGEVESSRSNITIRRGGTLASLGTTPPREDYLVTGFMRACVAAGVGAPASLAFDATSEIPVARGLGSSAAALVAGAMLADALLDLGLGRDGVLAVGADIEGHPDNVAPMVLGGAVLAVPTLHVTPAEAGVHASRPTSDVDAGFRRHDDQPRYAAVHLDVHDSLGFALAIPDFETSTREMRAALPASVAHRDAVRAAGKAAALVRGLATGDARLLAHALDDVLHVPYRRALVAGYDDVVAAALGAGAYGATLSGAGSALLAVAPRERAAAVADAMCDAWRASGVGAEASVARIAAGAETTGR